MSKPRILLTNDDGISAPGLEAIADCLAKVSDLIVVAPDRPRSAASSAITLYEPLIVRRRDRNEIPSYSVSGTPADSAKLALRELLEDSPDIVVSGINHGLNTGSNILYSGTVAAAMEGGLVGIPSFAVSVEAVDSVDYGPVAARAVEIIMELRKGFPRGAVYNLNYPAEEPKGTLITRQEHTAYDEVFDKREDPRGRTYYWIGELPEAKINKEELKRGGIPTDVWALAHGYASITPLRHIMTCDDTLDVLKKLWDERES